MKKSLVPVLVTAALCMLSCAKSKDDSFLKKDEAKITQNKIQAEATTELKLLNQLFQLDNESYYLLEGQNHEGKECSVLIKKESDNFDISGVNGHFDQVEKNGFKTSTNALFGTAEAETAMGRYAKGQDKIVVDSNEVLSIAMFSLPMQNEGIKFVGQVMVSRYGAEGLAIDEALHNGTVKFIFIEKNGYLVTDCQIKTSKKSNY